MKTMRVLASILAAAFLASCNQSSPKLGPPDEVVQSIDVSVDRSQGVASPKVDILFVIDNSLSMTKHQENLSRNIDGFVAAFAKNASIDFHIGFVPIYDSVKFGTVVKDYYPLGHLLGLRNPENPKGPRLQGLPFITPQTPDYLNILKATLNEGEEDGPEYEESFSPVEAALSAPVAEGPNQGFYRPDAYLVPVFLTDADDASPGISADGFYDFLYNLKNDDREKIMPIGVIVPVDAPATCPRDPSGPPYKITRFLTMAQGEILSLCSEDFGSQLAAIGAAFSRRVSRQVIPLSAVPDPNTLKVTFGSQTVPPDIDKGWSYDTDSNSVILGGDLELKPEPGAKIRIQFTAVNLLNATNGRTRRMDQSSR